MASLVKVPISRRRGGCGLSGNVDCSRGMAPRKRLREFSEAPHLRLWVTIVLHLGAATACEEHEERALPTSGAPAGIRSEEKRVAPKGSTDLGERARPTVDDSIQVHPLGQDRSENLDCPMEASTGDLAPSTEAPVVFSGHVDLDLPGNPSHPSLEGFPPEMLSQFLTPREERWDTLGVHQHPEIEPVRGEVRLNIDWSGSTPSAETASITTGPPAVFDLDVYVNGSLRLHHVAHQGEVVTLRMDAPPLRCMPQGRETLFLWARLGIFGSVDIAVVGRHRVGATAASLPKSGGPRFSAGLALVDSGLRRFETIFRQQAEGHVESLRTKLNFMAETARHLGEEELSGRIEYLVQRASLSVPGLIDAGLELVTRGDIDSLALRTQVITYANLPQSGSMLQYETARQEARPHAESLGLAQRRWMLTHTLRKNWGVQ